MMVFRACGRKLRLHEVMNTPPLESRLAYQLKQTTQSSISLFFFFPHTEEKPHGDIVRSHPQCRDFSYLSNHQFVMIIWEQVSPNLLFHWSSHNSSFQQQQHCVAIHHTIHSLTASVYLAPAIVRQVPSYPSICQVQSFMS